MVIDVGLGDLLFWCLVTSSVSMYNRHLGRLSDSLLLAGVGSIRCFAGVRGVPGVYVKLGVIAIVYWKSCLEY